MQMPKDVLIVVADGRKTLFFRNEGGAEHPQLELEGKHEQENPPNRVQKASDAGRSFASGGAHRSKMQETDFHQLEEDRFAAEMADILYKRAHDNDFEKLIVVAPPQSLGELRKNYHQTVRERLIGEIDKDLTGHTVSDIEKIVAAAE
ncbi:host attachment family protein [Parasphingopyxis lamellibrachiae]|uniref:Protein required for attachment to host cells n=1 Tax=Parasphingopyxis lamellibrachiae TaxID=680125 RepID=A0A3D9FDL0_9SPHN|nr:host attachment family protein [Parasphingopyxis lamellibrachiae]RED15869.1 protein required for attachment to host cells [Parasphingopyxis lamellibrachiae]